MPATRAKAQGEIDAFRFNTAIQLDFPTVVLSGTTQNNSIIAARLWVPTCVKIYRVIAAMYGSLAGTCSLNVVRGIAARVANSGGTLYAALPIPDTDYMGQPIAPNTQAYPPAYATAGQSLFLTDQALTVAEDPATSLTPEDSALTGAYAPGTPGKAYDGLWGPGGAELTLRLPCSGFTGNVVVRMLAKVFDPIGDPAGSSAGAVNPQLSSFDPANDIP